MSWIHSKSFDLTFILAPPFLVLLSFLLFPQLTSEQNDLGIWGWVLVVLAVDVAHVYSSLWRTYWHRENLDFHRTRFIAIPIAVWVIGVLTYNISGKLFWTLVAYTAVFHFMRQQYGFMRLYSRQEKQTPVGENIDFILIHALCLYPVIHWHAHLPRNFNWMVPGDFIPGLPVEVVSTAFVLYLFIIATYLVKEIKGGSFNLQKNLIILSTGLTWYFGIVYFNGDVAFTLTNVLAHGIPYMALVYAHERKDFTRLAKWWGPLAFVSLLLVFAYGEEALWAGLVWREHLTVFEFMSRFPQVTDPVLLSLLVPLLTLPQATHYVLDGFIWKKYN